MKPTGFVGAIAGVILPLFVLSQAALARPREPWLPLPELTPVLHRERLDDFFWAGSTEARLTLPGVGVLVESWSGYALERAGVVAPFVVAGLAVNGQTNVAAAGALRFWLRPYWSSAPAGQGPGERVCLVELLAAEKGLALSLWRLEVCARGEVLALVRQGDKGDEVLIRVPIDWRAGEWHQVAINYDPKATRLFVDGQAVGDGAGVATAPPGVLWLVWGSNADGKQAAEGELDELYTFAGPLEVGLQYSTLRERAALGPVSEAEERRLAEFAEAEAKRAWAESDRGEEFGRMRILGGTAECFTNVPVYLTNIVALFQTNAGWTVQFDVQGGPVGAYWDLFVTTNLGANHLTNAQWFWLERGPSCSTYQYTNQFGERSFYIVGRTNDTDGGGLPDAYERLVTHTDPNDSSDDRLLPLVSLYVTDSVAVEQQSTNTARFVVTRLGGLMWQPLSVGCVVSGAASNGVDYSLYGVTATPSNVLVTFAPGETAREITVAAVHDPVLEGSETVVLTLTTNVQPCERNAAHAVATAWILESYTKVFTSVADFSPGVLAGLEAVGSSPTNADGRLQFKTNLPPQFPFINVACSGRGTVARINTTNGQVVGEYRSTPAGLAYSGDSGPGPQPSRTTVDLFGNVWVANRADSRTIRGTNYGSITRIGLIIGGSRFEKLGTNYVPNPQGQYVALSNATYNTCVDRDGDGFIRTSRGLGDILPWNNDGGVDSEGGVSTAQDEAITEYVRVHCTGTRTIAVDKWNDIWVGGTGNRKHLKVNGLTGLPVPNSVFDP
ncbi:MAG: LamG-like jellyroll fold domain-containing protein, partial [Verrucomicrobiales bacterium]|nr:LamG-like jellyroll fold domain-containing protein [Verrucomicrobiales bacterium]